MCCHLYYSARLLICQPDWNIFFKSVYHLNPFGNKFIFWWLITVVFKMVLTFYNCICFSHKISPLCIKLYENMLVQYAYLSPTPHKGNRQTTVSCTVSRELYPCMVLMQPPNAVTRSRREYHYHSGCHGRAGGSPTLIAGFLAHRIAGHGVPDYRGSCFHTSPELKS